MTRPEEKGFTLLELLVVGALFAVILLVTSLLYFQGRDAVKLSMERVDTAGRSRRAMDTLIPLVSSAVETGGFEALEVWDTDTDNLDDACHMDITTREDFLNPSYRPTDAFDVLGPYHRFRIAFEPETQELKAYKLTIVPVAIDPEVPPRLLARNVLGCKLEKVTVGSVLISLEIGADKPDPSRPDGITKSTLNAILSAPGSRQ